MKRKDGNDYKESVVKIMWNLTAKQLQEMCYPKFNYKCNPSGDIEFSDARAARDARNLEANATKRKVSSSAFTTEELSKVVSIWDENTPEDNWYIDSGATVHVTNGTYGLINEKPCESKEISTADNGKIPINRMGNVELKIMIDEVIHTVTVKNVMYAPDISTNLLSVSKITELGHTVIFDAHKCKIYDSGNNLIASATQINGMYQLDRPHESVNVVSKEDSFQNSVLWHNRMGHPSKNILKGIDSCVSCAKEEEEVKHIPYRQAIGSLMYLCQATRPDLSFAVGLLSRFNHCFGKAHWSAVKRVFRYLMGTKDWKLEYSCDDSNDLIGYSDADWANDSDDRKSITGYAYIFQNGLISWNSRKQPTVALSSTEAEYMALSAATQESIYLRDLLIEILPNFENKSIIIRCDNKGAINLANTENCKQRTKHIDVRHHFIRVNLEKKTIKLEQVGTKNMLADVFTKSLPAPAMKTLVKEMRMRNLFCSAGSVRE
ncbi:hypothetical protein ILUMI_24645 [Ignelater luminosus]|uniref:Retrovirus-related Pol polyprotein from transposon TNT 1-94-like beta-barrel domain-containing protein n=1 Tax=Ignelater luminosus TaxID=2038154 RepID=A0A8K0CC52_IGNLU|nr:hypothetical protein ILUMI_24645 [Ignelater luminosus]